MSDDHSGHFIVPLRYYVMTLCMLLFLTVITVLVAQIDLGSFNIVVALLVAVVKASFVIMFFMGMRWDEAFNKVVLFGSLLFVVLFLVIVMADVLTRTGVYANEDELINIKSPVHLVEPGQSHSSESKH